MPKRLIRSAAYWPDVFLGHYDVVEPDSADVAGTLMGDSAMAAASRASVGFVFVSILTATASGVKREADL